jgi:hypothetical protein
MPTSIYGPRPPQQPRQQTNQQADITTLQSINKATGILSDLLTAGPQGKIIAIQRFAVLISMLDLKIKAAR